MADIANTTCHGNLLERYFFTNDISPDGQWIALPCGGEQGTFNIVSTDRSKIWSVPTLEVLIDGNSTFFSVYRWSLDKKYMFFNPIYYRGDGRIFIPEVGLFRLDLKTGEVNTILKPIGSYGFSLSPDDQTLVYTNNKQPKIIHVHNMISEEDQEVNLPQDYTELGNFVWTHDSKNAIFVAGLGNWREENKGLSLFLYNLESQELFMLIENDKRNLYPHLYATSDPWVDENMLLLDSFDGPGVWQLDIRTNQLIVFAAPTSHP